MFERERRVFSSLLLGLLALSCAREPNQSRLTVFAAASLRESFSVLENTFESAHPGVDVVLHCAGSQELRTQIEHGALADVFASADLAHMEKLEATGLAQTPHIFARNVPVIVVATSASARIRSLADLPKTGRIVIGTPEVPIGRYTERILERANGLYGADFRRSFLSSVVSKELNVKQVLAKVRLGEANAGIVYKTDVLGESSLNVVEIPESIHVVAEYPIAILRPSRFKQLAQAWVELVLSDTGQDSLVARSFLPARAGD